MISSEGIEILNIEQGTGNDTCALAAGTMLCKGRYRIISTLAQGGFGITYLGTDTSTGRSVAIKEFFMKQHCERSSNSTHVTLGTQGIRKEIESYRLKFLKEANTISQLNHPHIISIYNVFEENGTAYYVMKYIANGSLKDIVEQQGALSEKTALSFIRKIGSALNYIHGKKILHLDIKPANILLDDKQPILIDFGISKRYDVSGHQTSSTPVGISKGFAPMEQYSQGGIKGFDPSTDVYSLGATLFYLLTGEVPPEASIINEDGLPPLPNNITVGTAQAIEKAMQPKRKDRPQSVADFLNMLSAKKPAVSEPKQEPVKETHHKKAKYSMLTLMAVAILAPLILIAEFYIFDAMFESEGITTVAIISTLPLIRVIIKIKEDIAFYWELDWKNVIKTFFYNLLLQCVVAGIIEVIYEINFEDDITHAFGRDVSKFLSDYIPFLFAIIAMEIAAIKKENIF